MLTAVIMILIHGISVRAEELPAEAQYLSSLDALDSSIGESQVPVDFSNPIFDDIDVFDPSISNIIQYEDGTIFVIKDLGSSVNYHSDSMPDIPILEDSPSPIASTSGGMIPTEGLTLPSFSSSFVRVYFPWSSSGLGLAYANGSTVVGQYLYGAGGGYLDVPFQSKLLFANIKVSNRNYDYYIFDVTSNLSGRVTVNKNEPSASVNASLIGGYVDLVSSSGSSYRAPIGGNQIIHVYSSSPFLSMTVTPHIVVSYNYYAAKYIQGFTAATAAIGSIDVSLASASISLNAYGFTFHSSSDERMYSFFSGTFYTNFNNKIADLKSSITNLNNNLTTQTNLIRSDISAFKLQNHNDIVNLRDSVVNSVNSFKNMCQANFTQWTDVFWSSFVRSFNSFAKTNHTDLTNILHVLQSADGANGPLDDANNDFKNEMDEFDKVTDTSGQYDKIDPSIFEFDSTIFTSIAGTAVFFGDLLTAAFSAFGQFAVPLRLFLVCTLVSVVIGIVTNRSD